MREFKTLMLGAAIALGGVGTAFAQVGTAFEEEDKPIESGLTRRCSEDFQVVRNHGQHHAIANQRRGRTTKMWCAVLDREGLTLLIRPPTQQNPWPTSHDRCVARKHRDC